MELRPKDALRPKNARPAPIIQVLCLVKPIGRLASMSINALGILASAAVSTARHARHNLEDLELFWCGRHIVTVGAFVAIGTLLAQKMDVAHLELADFVDGFFVIFEGGVHALAFAVAGDCLFGHGKGEDGLRDWGRKREDGRCGCGFVRPSRDRTWLRVSAVADGGD